MGGTAVTKDADAHVTCTHHPGIIRVTSPRMKVPERVGTMENASKVIRALLRSDNTGRGGERG